LFLNVMLCGFCFRYTTAVAEPYRKHQEATSLARALGIDQAPVGNSAQECTSGSMHAAPALGPRSVASSLGMTTRKRFPICAGGCGTQRYIGPLRLSGAEAAFQGNGGGQTLFLLGRGPYQCISIAMDPDHTIHRAVTWQSDMPSDEQGSRSESCAVSWEIS
jgi:hypothetical protein